MGMRYTRDQSTIGPSGFLDTHDFESPLPTPSTEFLPAAADELTSFYECALHCAAVRDPLHDFLETSVDIPYLEALGFSVSHNAHAPTTFHVYALADLTYLVNPEVPNRKTAMLTRQAFAAFSAAIRSHIPSRDFVPALSFVNTSGSTIPAIAEQLRMGEITDILGSIGQPSTPLTAFRIAMIGQQV